MNQPEIILITGIMASGKSTVAQALAERLPASVHLRGDIFRRMIVNGRLEIVARREAGRAKTGYGQWTPAMLDHGLRTDTPRIGLWLDTSALTIDQTVDAILAQLT